jgi:hypothetical protein
MTDLTLTPKSANGKSRPNRKNKTLAETPAPSEFAQIIKLLPEAVASVGKRQGFLLIFFALVLARPSKLAFRIAGGAGLIAAITLAVRQLH